MDTHAPLILVIDADADLRDLYRALFEDAGFAVAALPTPDPTTAWVRANRPSAVVLELRFGTDGAAGLHFLRNLRADRAAAGVAAVVCTSVVLSEADRDEIAALEAVILPKPFAIDDLLGLVGHPCHPCKETTPC